MSHEQKRDVKVQFNKFMSEFSIQPTYFLQLTENSL